MRIVNLVVAHPTGAGPGTPALFGDVVWAHAHPGHRLEHLHVTRLDATSIRLVLFLRAPSMSEALASARALVDAACAGAGALSGWRVTGWEPVPPLTVAPLGTAPRFDPS